MTAARPTCCHAESTMIEGRANAGSVKKGTGGMPSPPSPELTRPLWLSRNAHIVETTTTEVTTGRKTRVRTKPRPGNRVLR